MKPRRHSSRKEGNALSLSLWHNFRSKLIVLPPDLLVEFLGEPACEELTLVAALEPRVLHCSPEPKDCSEELLRQQSCAIKNQLGHPKPPSRGFGWVVLFSPRYKMPQLVLYDKILLA